MTMKYILVFVSRMVNKMFTYAEYEFKRWKLLELADDLEIAIPEENLRDAWRNYDFADKDPDDVDSDEE